MKQFTATELGNALNYNPTTIRTWARKPIVGQPYTPDAINIEFVRSQLKKTFSTPEQIEAATQALGCTFDEIELTKAIRANAETTKLDFSELIPGQDYVLISHVYKHDVRFIGAHEITNHNTTPGNAGAEHVDTLYIFENLKDYKSTQDKYRVVSLGEIESQGNRWSIREAR